jgi:hypothetical protein
VGCHDLGVEALIELSGGGTWTCAYCGGQVEGTGDVRLADDPRYRGWTVIQRTTGIAHRATSVACPGCAGRGTIPSVTSGQVQPVAWDARSADC